MALRLGLDVHRFHPASAPGARRARLLASDQIDLVIDGGASAGQYARLLRASGYPGGIVSFEPLSAPFQRLAGRAARDPLWSCHNVALGEASRETTINVSTNSLSSSLLEITELHEANAPDSAVVSREEVTMVRLDDVTDPLLDAATRVFLKLDLQGGELAALHGAHDTLERVRAVEVELSLAELYSGQPLLPDVYDHLAVRGFRCVGLDPVFVDDRTGYLLQLDGLFVRDSVAHPTI